MPFDPEPVSLSHLLETLCLLEIMWIFARLDCMLPVLELHRAIVQQMFSINERATFGLLVCDGNLRPSMDL